MEFLGVVASVAVIVVLLRFLIKGRTRPDDQVSERWLSEDKARRHDR